MSGFRFSSMWAYLAVPRPPDDDEGVVALIDPKTRQMKPAIGGVEAKVRALRPELEKLAAVSGFAIRLVRFDQRTDLEAIAPAPHVLPAPPRPPSHRHGKARRR